MKILSKFLSKFLSEKPYVPTMEVKCFCGKEIIVHPTDLKVSEDLFSFTCPFCQEKNYRLIEDLTEEFALILG